jgi:hypothetical protein
MVLELRPAEHGAVRQGLRIPPVRPRLVVHAEPGQRMNPRWRKAIEADAARFAAYLEHPTVGPRPRGVVTSWDQYLKLFQRAAPGQAIGEASIGCLWSETAAQSIAERIPDARIIMILRNPADRAFSQYLHAATRDRVRASFGELIRRSPGTAYDSFCPFLEFGLYFRQVERFVTRFPAHRVGVYLYDDYARDAGAMVRDILRLLGVRGDHPIDTSKRHLEPRVPRIPIVEHLLVRPARKLLGPLVPPRLRRVADRIRFRPRNSLSMTPADRRFLNDFYEDDVKQLSRLIGRDLSGWLA